MMEDLRTMIEGVRNVLQPLHSLTINYVEIVAEKCKDSLFLK